MTKQAITQSEKRFQESLGVNFNHSPLEKADFIFLKSSTDIGVERNLGRNGARFAPQSFLSHFKKLTRDDFYAEKSWIEQEVANEDIEKKDFDLAQETEANNIHQTLALAKEKAQIIHLGGGHDHIYPLLKALSKDHKQIVVLNIDAHTDTRVDQLSNSGTPFRQFEEEFSGEFHLFQYGIQEFANSISTLSPLKKGNTYTLLLKDINNSTKQSEFLTQLKKVVNSETAFILSLDVDALDGSLAPGVSAVNGIGLNADQLNSIFEITRELKTKKYLIGIYEMNPVYDSLSMKTIRFMTNWLYESLRK